VGGVEGCGDRGMTFVLPFGSYILDPWNTGLDGMCWPWRRGLFWRNRRWRMEKIRRLGLLRLLDVLLAGRRLQRSPRRESLWI
jgi:hypothetical protein